MSEARILGYVMARDEWPLLAVAGRPRALERHVDHVLVVDHASRGRHPGWPDGTPAGSGLDGSPSYRLDGEDFHQEATTTVMTRVGGVAAYSWVYVFDADEFLLHRDRAQGCARSWGTSRTTSTSSGTRSTTGSRPTTSTRTISGRYGGDPVIDLDPPSSCRSPGCSPQIWSNTGMRTSSTCPSARRASSWPRWADRIAGRGSLAQSSTLTSGSSPYLRRGLRAGHVPLVEPRPGWPGSVLHGQRLKDSGFPPHHGWQSRMIRRLEVGWAARRVLGSSTPSRRSRSAAPSQWPEIAAGRIPGPRR